MVHWHNTKLQFSKAILFNPKWCHWRIQQPCGLARVEGIIQGMERNGSITLPSRISSKHYLWQFGKEGAQQCNVWQASMVCIVCHAGWWLLHELGESTKQRWVALGHLWKCRSLPVMFNAFVQGSLRSKSHQLTCKSGGRGYSESRVKKTWDQRLENLGMALTEVELKLGQTERLEKKSHEHMMGRLQIGDK